MLACFESGEVVKGLWNKKRSNLTLKEKIL